MRARRFGTLIGLLLLCAVLWALTPHFLTVSNLLNVAQQTAINAIAAAGMTFVIISGGIDLAPGAVIEAVKGIAARADPRISLRFTTLEEQVAHSVQRERVLALLSGSFAILAFVLAALLFDPEQRFFPRRPGGGTAVGAA